jgi:ABC-type amino acid transport substrate-binding protein
MFGRVAVSTRLLALVALLALAVGWSACRRASEEGGAAIQTLQPGILQVCLYPGFAPFASKDGDRWVGADVDYLQAFATQQKLTFQPVEIAEFSGIWNLPGKGTCDLAATGISDLKERRDQTGEAGLWSDHYYRVVRSFAVATGATLNGVEDLRDKTVIVTGDSTADHDLRNRLERAGLTNSVTIETTTDEAAAAIQVRDGGGVPFAYGGGLGSIQDLVQRLGGLAVAWQHCNMLDDGSEVDEPFSFVVRAQSTGLADALNRYIAGGATYGLPEPDLECPPAP